MGLIVESAFELAKLGGIAFRIDSTLVSSATGLYTHSDWSSVTTNETTSQLETISIAIALATGDVDYALTYDTAARTYTLSHDTSTFEVDFTTDGPQGYIARSILGFSGNLSGADSYTSDVVPWFTLEAPLDCKGALRPDYESGDAFSGGSQNGVIYSQAPTTVRKNYDFQVQYIPRAELFKHLATSTQPWTWEEFIYHHRLGYTFFCDDGTPTGHKLRADGTSFKPVQIHPDYHGEYHLDLRTYVYR